MRNGLVGLLGATLVAAALPAAGCADYSSGAGTGGAAATTGGSTSTGGSTGGSSAGTGGSTGGSGTGGAGGAPTGGTGGAVTGGAGGASGTATGGAGAAATGGAGTAGSGGGAAGGSAGSGAGAPSCTNVTPCGGDVIGTWTVMSSCLKMSGDLDLSKAGIGCTAAPITGALQVTAGTWTADADGMSFSDTTTMTGDAQVKMPAACLEVSGTSTTCDRVGSAVEGLGYTGVTCADNADAGCDCVGSVQQTGGIGLVSGDAALTSATYTTADNVLTTTDGRHTFTYSYCVAGSTLTLTPLGMPTITTGSIVLQKQ